MRNRGIISFIVLFIIAVLLISVFKVNLKGYIDASPENALDNNVVLIIETGKIIWRDYIRGPLEIVWNKYIKGFARGENLEGLKNDLNKSAEIPAN